MVSQVLKGTGRSFAQPMHSREGEDKAHLCQWMMRIVFWTIWNMAREWTALLARFGSLHFSKAGGWSPPRSVSAGWWNGQHSDLEVVLCRLGCLPIISQDGNLLKPNHSKRRKSQTSFYVSIKKSPCLLPGLFHWSSIHNFEDIQGTWRMK